jgi:hypothetical protein
MNAVVFDADRTVYNIQSVAIVTDEAPPATADASHWFGCPDGLNAR